jgi:hypothetical protein
MASQLESLKASLARLEPLHGADNPFVKGLQGQIALLEKPRADNPMGTGRSLPQALSAGMRSDPPESKEPPEDSPEQGALRVAKLKAQNAAFRKKR